MAEHSAVSRTNGTQWVIVALVVLVLVISGLIITSLARGGDDSTSEASRDNTPGVERAIVTGDAETTSAADAVETASIVDATPGGDAAAATDEQRVCRPITVWAAPRLAPVVEAAAERVADDCFDYRVGAHADASAQIALRGGERPDVWVPGSVAWPQLLSEEGVPLQVGETVASSPVLLVGEPPVVDELQGMGIGPGTTWTQFVEQVQQLTASGSPGQITMRVGDPRIDAATMSLLSSTGMQPGGWTEADSPQREMLVILAHSATQDDPLRAIASNPSTLVPATEEQLGVAKAEGAKLAGLALKDGLGVVQIPFVRVGGGSEKAVDALEDQLTSAVAAEDLEEIWFRAGSNGPGPGVPGVPQDVMVSDEVDPAAVTLTADTWAAIARQSRILTLIDISLSMEEPVGDTTRIDLTREAAQTALQAIPARTGVGVWYFATALEGDQDWTQVVPLRPLGERVDGGTQRDLLMSVTDELRVDTLTGDTGLHDALWAAYQQMQAEWTPESVNSVLLLTDGMNNDSTGGLSEDEVMALLTAAREAGDRPVTVVLIGMGPEVDEAALVRLATAAGGEAVVLRDPRELPQVFVDIVARRPN